MLISLNELKKLVKIDIADEELFKLIGSRLVEIERVEDLAPKYKKIYAVKVLEAKDIEGTHLHLCKIDAGKALNAEVNNEHANYIQVVCGAPNVKAGMMAAWISPGAIVPVTYGTNGPFEISARELRGHISYGMLAAADELALGSDHEGIIELDPSYAKPGDALADILDLNDKIIEVENKSLTHRPDCFGLIGFAREVAGILGQPFENNYNDTIDDAFTKAFHKVPAKSGFQYKYNVNLDDESDECSRFFSVIFEFDSLPTRKPYLTKDDVFLIKAGMKPVSPLVDVTNVIMLKTGQPLHAYDFDKVAAVGGNKDKVTIGVRLARDSEKLVLLDGNEISLTPDDIVVTSSDVPIALAGAMGGDATKVDDNTKHILVEVASFSLYNLRKTQMAHGIFSEAITRFTKGRPTFDIEPAMIAAIESFTALGGVEVGGAGSTTIKVIKEQTADSRIAVSVSDINSLLGSEYTKDQIISTLENVGFKVETSTKDNLKVKAPRWRADIHIKEDIIEEIGRLLGFDNLPLTFPLRPFVCANIEPILEFKTKIRTILSDRLGANEVLTYSFISRALQEKAGENPDDSYQIVNSISPELECFRQSIIPSILDKVRDNEKAGFEDFTLYELNQVTKKSWGLNEENVPIMKNELGLVLHGDFYDAKHIALELERSLGLKFEFEPLATSTLLEPSHSVAIIADGEQIGELGEIRNSVKKRFKLEKPLAALRLTLENCPNAKAEHKSSIKLLRFPSISRDLTFRVKDNVKFAEVESGIKTVLSNIKGISYTLEPVSIFRKGREETKNLSFHLEVANENKTLNSAEISDIIKQITNSLKTLGAEVV